MKKSFKGLVVFLALLVSLPSISVSALTDNGICDPSNPWVCNLLYTNYANVNYQRQETNYWCGPAAAKMVGDAIGINRGWSQSQWARQLGTTTNGTGADALARNLNYTYLYSAPNKYGYVNWTHIGWMRFALKNSNPAILNAAMDPGDYHLPGYPSWSSVYHYAVIYRVGQNYNGLSYYDPFTNYSGFPNVRKYESISFELLFAVIGGRGLVQK